MIGFLIALLTLVMVADCLILIFLVLIQLPKKEAGAGLAFGAGATDALFGAGSGTVLTKITKYAATTFFVLAVILSVMQMGYHRRTSTEFEKNLEKPGRTVAPAAAAPAPAQPLNPVVSSTNTTFLTTTAAELTNTPAVQTNISSTNLAIPTTNAAPQ